MCKRRILFTFFLFSLVVLYRVLWLRLWVCFWGVWWSTYFEYFNYTLFMLTWFLQECFFSVYCVETVWLNLACFCIKKGTGKIFEFILSLFFPFCLTSAVLYFPFSNVTTNKFDGSNCVHFFVYFVASVSPGANYYRSLSLSLFALWTFAFYVCLCCICVCV